jgi:hypothetical protein
MISYCIAVYRPVYARLLLADLVAKTTSPFEILLWLNTADVAFEEDIAELTAHGVTLRVLGRTPENIGMVAYQKLFREARYSLLVQIDDDVICVSRYIAERAHRLFERFPGVRQLVADVWQDEFTTGARPALELYRPYDAAEGLFNGPIDGWFSIYHRSILPMLLALPVSSYCYLGAMVRAKLAACGQLGLLDRGMKVFHVIGPEYASHFGMLDFEIEKYRRLGRADIVAWYEGWRARADRMEPPSDRVEAILAALGQVGAVATSVPARASPGAGALC